MILISPIERCFILIKHPPLMLLFFCKVFMGCGEPTLTHRSKRSYPPEVSIPRVSRSLEKIVLGDLGQILQEVRDNLSSSGDLFRNMTGAACTPLLAKTGRSSSNNTNSDDNCWNGTAKARSVGLLITMMVMITKLMTMRIMTMMVMLVLMITVESIFCEQSSCL